MKDKPVKSDQVAFYFWGQSHFDAELPHLRSIWTSHCRSLCCLSLFYITASERLPEDLACGRTTDFSEEKVLYMVVGSVSWQPLTFPQKRSLLLWVDHQWVGVVVDHQELLNAVFTGSTHDNFILSESELPNISSGLQCLKDGSLKIKSSCPYLVPDSCMVASCNDHVLL